MGRPRPSLMRLGGPSTNSITFFPWLISAATLYAMVKARWPSAKQLAWHEDENLASARSCILTLVLNWSPLSTLVS